MTLKHHGFEVRNAIICLWSKADASKGNVWYEIEIFTETNSNENRAKSGRPCSRRTPNAVRKHQKKDRKRSKKVNEEVSSRIQYGPKINEKLEKV